MNVAIGLGTLLLGGWVLNTPVVDLPPDQVLELPVLETPMQQPAAPANARPQPRSRYQNPERALPRDEVQQRLRNQNQPQTRTNPDLTSKQRSQQGNDANPQPNTPKRPAWVLPPLPTDPLRANSPGQPAMPLPPTVREGDLEMGPPPADPYASPTTANAPDVPISRRAYSPRTADSPSNYDMADQMRDRIESSTHPAYGPQPTSPKAFATARPFSSGVSPYMNLFRNDTAGGTIDNYSTYVRPSLDQRSMNQQLNMDIYGLERAQRIQNAALQQLGRYYNARAPQQVGTPQFYRNYGSFYPGANGQSSYGQGGYGQSPYGP
jgi:hypothetical protein